MTVWMQQIVPRTWFAPNRGLGHGYTHAPALRLRPQSACLVVALFVGLGVASCDERPAPPPPLQPAPECTTFGTCIESCLDQVVPDDQVFKVEYCAARCMPVGCNFFVPSGYNIEFGSELSEEERAEHCLGLAAAMIKERAHCPDYPVAMCGDGCQLP